MKTFRIVPFILLALGIAGCATTKPQLPESKYYEFARVAVAGQKCSEFGFFSAEETSIAFTAFGRALNSWDYDAAKGNQITQDTQVTINADVCKKLLVEAYVAKQRWEQAQQVQYQPTPVYVPQTRNTFCNRVGTQLLCNSF